jgi:hypothetical protein
VNLAFFLALCLLLVSTNSAYGEDTSQWETYRDTEMGFEVKMPTSWKVGGKVKNTAPVTKGSTYILPIMGPSSIDGSKMSITFSVQVGTNPENLSIQDWLTREVSNVQARFPGMTIEEMSIGQRAAAKMELLHKSERKLQIYVDHGNGEIFGAELSEPAGEDELHRTYMLILSTIRFID